MSLSEFHPVTLLIYLVRWKLKGTLVAVKSFIVFIYFCSCHGFNELFLQPKMHKLDHWMRCLLIGVDCIKISSFLLINNTGNPVLLYCVSTNTG